jgi:hypothetical protein
MTIPTLILPVFVSLSFVAECQFAGRLDCTSPRRMELAPSDPGSFFFVNLIQVTFCRTLVTLFLIGSAVSVATF